MSVCRVVFFFFLILESIYICEGYKANFHPGPHQHYCLLDCCTDGIDTVTPPHTAVQKYQCLTFTCRCKYTVGGCIFL